MNIIPTVIEKTNHKEYAYDLYSRLLVDRIVFLSGEVTDASADLIISELLYLDSLNHDEISFYIHSPGGSVTAGLAIYDTMNFIKSDVRTIGIGMAASMGAFLLASGTKGKRMALENTEIMIHQPLGGMQGQATDMQIHCEHILALKKKLNQILAKNSGQKIATIEKDTERDHFMNAIEAKKYGLIDAVL